MSIDSFWRGFLRGSNQLTLVSIIQDGTQSFLEYMIKEGLLEADGYSNEEFNRHINTSDLWSLSNFFYQNIRFTFGESTLLRFIHQYKKSLPHHKAFNDLLNSGDIRVSTLVRHNDFFRSAKALIDMRNIDSHQQEPRNDSGWSLLAAGHVMTLVELKRSVKDKEEFFPLKTNLTNLLKEIIDIEAQEKFQDEEDAIEDPQSKNDPSEFNMVLLESSLKEILKDVLEEKNQQSETFFNSISKRMEKQLNEGLVNFQNTFLEKSLIDTKEEKINALIEDIDDMPSGEIILEPLAKPLEISLSEEEVERFSTPLTAEQIKSFELTPEEASKSFNLQLSPEFYEENIAPHIAKLLTPSQADREMLMMQKKFKKKFRCKNWENIAQGPFRREILHNEIYSMDSFFENNFIKRRYEEHKQQMDRQITSELGSAFFSLLRKINWD